MALSAALRRSIRSRHLDSHDAQLGFTLVEVVVAMVIFAIMVPATLGVVTKTTQGVQENRSRVVAASLASAQIEKVRTLAASSVSAGSSTSTVGNVAYTVTQAVTTATADGSSTSCVSISAAVVYALVSVSVSWPQMGSIKPVKADTLIRATTPGTGALGVSVTGSSGQAVSGIPVTLSNGTVVTTNSNGCAVFINLVPGSYTASLNSAGYVGTTGTQAVTSPPATVVANEVTRVTMIYDLSMSLTIQYTAPNGGALTAGQLAQVPSEFQTGQVVAPARTSAVNLPGTVSSLYPAAYSVKSFPGGTCTLGIKDMSSGTPSSQTIGIPTATVGITNITTGLAIGNIKAIYKGPTAGSGITCPVGTTIDIGYVFSIFGNHSALLPLGQWRIQYPWNPLGFIPIPGLTVICSDISLSLTSPSAVLLDVGNLISSVSSGLLSNGGC